MNRPDQSVRLLVLSVRLYRVLLLLYPAEFRREFGGQLVQVFRDVCRDSYRRRGVVGLAAWWGVALFDLLRSVLVERREMRFAVSGTKLNQWSGWLCIFGGSFILAAGVSQLLPSSGASVGAVYVLSLYALVPGMVLVMLGLLGIWLRYRRAFEWFSRTALWIMLISAGVTALSWLLILIVSVDFWSVFLVGWLVHMGAQTAFGGYMATTHLLPKWNFALLISSVLPLTVIVLVLRSIQPMESANWAAFVVLLLISLGWLLVGGALNSQSSAELTPVMNP